jgi:hypothetical protein
MGGRKEGSRCAKLNKSTAWQNSKQTPLFLYRNACKGNLYYCLADFEFVHVLHDVREKVEI